MVPVWLFLVLSVYVAYACMYVLCTLTLRINHFHRVLQILDGFRNGYFPTVSYVAIDC